MIEVDCCPNKTTKTVISNCAITWKDNIVDHQFINNKQHQYTYGFACVYSMYQCKNLAANFALTQHYSLAHLLLQQDAIIWQLYWVNYVLVRLYLIYNTNDITKHTWGFEKTITKSNLNQITIKLIKNNMICINLIQTCHWYLWWINSIVSQGANCSHYLLRFQKKVFHVK